MSGLSRSSNPNAARVKQFNELKDSVATSQELDTTERTDLLAQLAEIQKGVTNSAGGLNFNSSGDKENTKIEDIVANITGKVSEIKKDNQTSQKARDEVLKVSRESVNTRLQSRDNIQNTFFAATNPATTSRGSQQTTAFAVPKMGRTR